MIHIKSDYMLSGNWADMGYFMSNMANGIGWFVNSIFTWGSGLLLHMAGYSSFQSIGISLLKYRWCYESV